MGHALLIIGAAAFTLVAGFFAEFSGFCMALNSADGRTDGTTTAAARTVAIVFLILAFACARAA